MVFLWFSFGFPMVFPWFSYGFSPISPISPLDRPIASPGFQFYLLGAAHDIHDGPKGPRSFSARVGRLALSDDGRAKEVPCVDEAKEGREPGGVGLSLNYRKTLYLMVKTMVSCRFSLQPIQ